MGESMYDFMIREKFITITAIGSIFTFAFMSSFKSDIIDPIIEFAMPEEYFNFMNKTIREGERILNPPKNIEIKFGKFFREFVTLLFVLAVLYTLSKTSFPDLKAGNYSGAAAM